MLDRIRNLLDRFFLENKFGRILTSLIAPWRLLPEDFLEQSQERKSVYARMAPFSVALLVAGLFGSSMSTLTVNTKIALGPELEALTPKQYYDYIEQIRIICQYTGSAAALIGIYAIGIGRYLFNRFYAKIIELAKKPARIPPLNYYLAISTSHLLWAAVWLYTLGKILPTLITDPNAVQALINEWPWTVFSLCIAFTWLSYIRDSVRAHEDIQVYGNRWIAVGKNIFAIIILVSLMGFIAFIGPRIN